MVMLSRLKTQLTRLSSVNLSVWVVDSPATRSEKRDGCSGSKPLDMRPMEERAGLFDTAGFIACITRGTALCQAARLNFRRPESRSKALENDHGT